MNVACIHGFRTSECASCRSCPHGLTASRCGRCLSAARPTRTRPAISVDAPTSQEHAGFEIFYVPEVSGWHYRGPDAAASPVSYRSIFLARKAVDRVVASSSGAKASSLATKSS